MSGLGYRQIAQHLRGECDLAEAIRRIKAETRRFVRRQAAWFRPADPAIRWFDAAELKVEDLVSIISGWQTADSGQAGNLPKVQQPPGEGQT
jgi:tRNA dimethylallyltransferase